MHIPHPSLINPLLEQSSKIQESMIKNKVEREISDCLYVCLSVCFVNANFIESSVYILLHVHCLNQIRCIPIDQML